MRGYQLAFRENTGVKIRSFVVGKNRYFQKLKRRSTPTGDGTLDFSKNSQAQLIPLICPPI